MDSKYTTANIPTIKYEENNTCKNMDSTDANDNSDKMEIEDVSSSDISQWQIEDVVEWATKVVQFTPTVIKCLQLEAIDGQVLLTLTEEDIRDFRYRLNYNLRFGELKKLWQSIHYLQQSRLQKRFNSHSTQHLPINHLNLSKNSSNRNSLSQRIAASDGSPLHHNHHRTASSFSAAAAAVTFICNCGNRNCGTFVDNCTFNDCESCALEMSSVSEGCSANIPPEFFKTSISLGKFV